MAHVFDHIDQRVRSLAKTKPFYDQLLQQFGFRGRPMDEKTHVYLRIHDHQAQEAIALIEDPAHANNCTRVAFRAESNEAVDRVGAILARIGALDIEGPVPCPEYAEKYYAVFFSDPDGNRLEVVYR
jgi:predicted lactoylglutathione lyase